MIFIASSTRSFFEGTAAFLTPVFLDGKPQELFSSNSEEIGRWADQLGQEYKQRPQAE